MCGVFSLVTSKLDHLTCNMYEFFLRNELPSLLEDFPLTVRVMYFRHDWAALCYTWHVSEYLHIFP